MTKIKKTYFSLPIKSVQLNKQSAWIKLYLINYDWGRGVGLINK